MKRFRAIPIVLVAAVLAAAPAVRAQGGHWEFSGHYGLWTLDVLKSAGADLLSDSVDAYVRDQLLEAVNESFPTLRLSAYQQDLVFDSRGHDLGAGVRWYPGGRRGSFSLGLSVEKSLFKVSSALTARLDLQDSVSGQAAVYNGTVTGAARIDALSFLLSGRWDIIPSSPIHPYITVGGGISTSKALDDSSVAYTHVGQVTGSGIAPTTVSGGRTKTLRQLRDENATDVSLPNVLPFVQLNVGLKARLTRMLQAFVDVGFFDGFMATAGLAIRL